MSDKKLKPNQARSTLNPDLVGTRPEGVSEDEDVFVTEDGYFFSPNTPSEFEVAEVEAEDNG